MIVLDTNVLSEVVKPRPSDSLRRWLSRQEPDEVFTTAITHAEILYGIEILPRGKRRSALSMAIDEVFAQEFRGRILPFDEQAARSFAGIAVARKAAGRPISQPDAMIAAIARSRGAVLATRNTSDFALCGIEIVDPWRSSLAD